MEHNIKAMSDIVGNAALKERLFRDVTSNTLSHAYIIEGASGSGKSTISLITAAALACKNRGHSNTLPCKECINCRKILELKSPDVIFIGSNGKTSLGIDNARFLKEDVHIIPNDLEQKFYVIEDADKMTVQAQNAILLTLEEPPAYVHFFLLCSNASSLLETIRSRAPVLRTEPISDKEIDQYICSHSSKAMQLKMSSPSDFDELIRASCGSIGKALELLEPKAFSSVMELRSLVKSFILSATGKKSAADILSALSKFSQKRDTLSDQLSLLLDAIRDLIVVKKSDTSPLRFYCNTEDTIELSDRVSISFLFELQQSVSVAIEECKRNANVKLLLTKMAISAGLI